MHKTLQPEGWARPLGYSNGVSARGRMVFVAGQVGWPAASRLVSDDLVAQIEQALNNIVAILACDGAKPEHIVSLNWYLADKREYNARLGEIGAVYRAVIGRHFPAMMALEISGFVEEGAKVEIQAAAVVPDA